MPCSRHGRLPTGGSDGVGFECRGGRPIEGGGRYCGRDPGTTKIHGCPNGGFRAAASAPRAAAAWAARSLRADARPVPRSSRAAISQPNAEQHAPLVPEAVFCYVLLRVLSMKNSCDSNSTVSPSVSS